MKAFIWGVPVINSLLLITSLIGWTSFSCLGLSFGIFLVLSFGIIKRATYIQETYGKQLKSLNGYARLIALAKAEDWKSAGMQELMERFTRGDSSRHTEGSGLGLSIAKSLTDLQKGDMGIYTDGDLFKVVLAFGQVNVSV